MSCGARKHGTAAAYQNDGCRCPEAREKQRVYAKQRKLARLRGQHGRTNLVPTWRAVRRARALARIGWSSRAVQAEAWGYGPNAGTGGWMSRPGMTPERFAKLDEVYQRWHMTPGPSRIARAHAVRNNYPAPLDWDNIDDPTEIPFNHTPEGRQAWRRVYFVQRRARLKEAA